jgi:hypothetical protein
VRAVDSLHCGQDRLFVVVVGVLSECSATVSLGWCVPSSGHALLPYIPCHLSQTYTLSLLLEVCACVRVCACACQAIVV